MAIGFRSAGRPVSAHGTHRSGCPINFTLEMLGDRGSLILIRDVMFGNRRHYRQRMSLTEEGIASNILADRLRRLVDVGLVSRRATIPRINNKVIYSLTEPAIPLVPLLAVMGAGGRHTPVSMSCQSSQSFSKRLVEPMWEAFMAELRSTHLGAPTSGRSVIAELQAVFDRALRRRSASPN